MKNKRTINHKINDKDINYLAGIVDSSSSFYLSQHSCGRKDPITGKYALRWVAGFVIQNQNAMLAKTIKNILFLGDSHTHTLNLMANGHNRRPLRAIRVCGPILDEI